MQQSGLTIEGLPVYSGVFPLVGTHGVPLEIVLDHFRQTGRVVDWPDYIDGAMKDGHKPRTIKSRILTAVGDVYGSVHRCQFEERLSRLMN